MKKAVIITAILGCVGLASAEEIHNPILKKLYEKGILTKEEAIQVEKEIKEEKKTKLSSKAHKIKFSGTDYIGYTFTDRKQGKDDGSFEIRRGYFITKFYFNKKDYARFTLDVTKHNHKDNPDEGKELDVKIKHLYLYKDISSIVPYTGFEIGMVHTPWLDYEEHSGWLFRSISKTFYESGDGAHLLPSADAGIDFKTKTKHISAEYGVFNGEGYDHIGRSDKGDKEERPSIEGRLTWHILGGGTKHLHAEKDIYANISLHALNSFNHRGSKDDLTVYQIHAVYNQPLFLVAAQYITADWYDTAAEKGDGYSVNFEFRPVLDHKVSFFGRYDHWDSDKNNNADRDQYIYGVAWRMNKYIRWIVNGITVDYDKADDKDKNKYMFTAEVSW